MTVFICWLISFFSDVVGALVIMYLLTCNAHFYEMLREMHAEGNYVIDFCATAAVVPAFLTATYAAINYVTTLSWAAIRWMSPLDVFSGRIFHFILTFIFSGAGWAMVLFFCMLKFFPNARCEWIVPFLKGISESMYNYLLT